MKPVIEVNNIYKQYLLKEDKTLFVYLKELLTKKLKGKQKNFFALRNISFKAYSGEVIGIIGRNGAGKSTLLKILSRIVSPSAGRAVINGKVVSLLEVGTGFHPDLTGRENIYLNGAILGMKRSDISQRIDKIINFAQIDGFLDTPVKFYSSGMYMRLAFAIAAHIDADVLLIDEVLAVGDIQFQRKCLGRMEEVANQGKVVLFVSHNLNTIQQLCNRCFLLNNGRIIKDSKNVKKVIDYYLNDYGKNPDLSSWNNHHKEYQNSWFTPLKIILKNQENKIVKSISSSEDVSFVVEGRVEQEDSTLCIGYALYAQDNTVLYWSAFTDQECFPALSKGRWILKGSIPVNLLNNGKYRISLVGSLHQKKWLFQPDQISPSIYFEVNKPFDSSMFWTNQRPGMLAPLLDWRVEKING